MSDLCENDFSGDVDLTTLALGRQSEKIRSILAGDVEMDEDLLMKLRGIAEEHNIEIGDSA